MFLRERYYRVIHFILQEADEDNGKMGNLKEWN